MSLAVSDTMRVRSAPLVPVAAPVPMPVEAPKLVLPPIRLGVSPVSQSMIAPPLVVAPRLPPTSTWLSLMSPPATRLALPACSETMCLPSVIVIAPPAISDTVPPLVPDEMPEPELMWPPSVIAPLVAVSDTGLAELSSKSILAAVVIARPALSVSGPALLSPWLINKSLPVPPAVNVTAPEPAVVTPKPGLATDNTVTLPPAVTKDRDSLPVDPWARRNTSTSPVITLLANSAEPRATLTPTSRLPEVRLVTSTVLVSTDPSATPVTALTVSFNARVASAASPSTLSSTSRTEPVAEYSVSSCASVSLRISMLL